MRDSGASYRGAESNQMLDVKTMTQMILNKDTNFTDAERYDINEMFEALNQLRDEDKVKTLETMLEVSMEEYKEMVFTWKLHEKLRERWRNNRGVIKDLRTRALSKDAYENVAVAWALQNEHKEFLAKYIGSWNREEQKKLETFDNLLAKKLTTGFLENFWKADDNFCRWCLTSESDYEHVSTATVKFTTDIFDTTSFCHLYVPTVATLRGHPQMGLVLNCLISRYIGFEVYTFLEHVEKSLGFDPSTRFTNQLEKHQTEYESGLHRRLRQVSESLNSVKDIYDAYPHIDKKVRDVILELKNLLSHPSLHPDFVPFGSVWKVTENNPFPPVVIGHEVYRTHEEELYESDPLPCEMFQFCAIPAIPTIVDVSTRPTDVSQDKDIIPVVQPFSFLPRAHEKLKATHTYVRSIYEKYMKNAKDTGDYLIAHEESYTKKRTPPSEIPSSGPVNKSMLHLDMVLGGFRSVKVQTTLPATLTEEAVVIPYGSCRYAQSFTDIDVFWMSTIPFSCSAVFEEQEQAWYLKNGQWVIKTPSLPDIDLHEKPSSSQKAEDWIAFVKHTMSIHDATEKRLKDEDKMTMYTENKKLAKLHHIYDSKYLMLRGVAIAHMDEPLNDWLNQDTPIKHEEHILYDPPEQLRRGMLRKMNRDKEEFEIIFEFSYDLPGSEFEPFIELLNIISGVHLWKGVMKKVTGDFVPNRRGDGTMSLLFWNTNGYTKPSVIDMANMFSFPISSGP